MSWKYGLVKHECDVIEERKKLMGDGHGLTIGFWPLDCPMMYVNGKYDIGFCPYCGRTPVQCMEIVSEELKQHFYDTVNKVNSPFYS